MTVAPLQVVGADTVAALLAGYATGSLEVTGTAREGARNVVADSLAVSLGALRHPAAQAARRHAYRFPGRGARIWGTGVSVMPELAALVNGVPLRGYDYNDLHMGRRNGGHPSDVVPALAAVAEWGGASGEQLSSALAVAYEVVFALFDTLPVGEAGWDYANLTAIGATCGVARLLGLSPGQAREALAITVIPHAASDEIESNELNSRGDLTMWKRFNGSDAMRQSVYACLLASAGVEGVVRPFTGRLGFLSRMGVGEDPLPELERLLSEGRSPRRVATSTFKRWPVGSRGQSAIQAALAARAQVPEGDEITAVRVRTDEAAYDHLVRIRENPWEPVSRETADHSLPYIVAGAVLDGRLHTDSFSPERVADPARRRFLKERVSVEVDPELCQGAAGGFPSRVEIETAGGRTFTGEAAPPPGHPKNPFGPRDFEAKLHENADWALGPEWVQQVISAVRGLETLPAVSDLTRLLEVRPGVEIDGEPAL